MVQKHLKVHISKVLGVSFEGAFPLLAAEHCYAVSPCWGISMLRVLSSMFLKRAPGAYTAFKRLTLL